MDVQMGPNCYDILGVSPAASSDDIRRAYKTKALETHPDKLDPDANEKDKEISEARFRQVHEAFQVLTDAEKRRAHDIKFNIPISRDSWGPMSDEQRRKIEERAAWARKMESETRDRLAKIREQRRELKEKVQQETKEHQTLVQDMVDELRQLNPEWEARKLAIQQRLAAKQRQGI